MSLVGNLEDLSLGDILQIISLSQKSGVLSLDSGGGAGRIVFVSGLVRGAAVDGGARDLKGVLLQGGFLDGAAWATAAAKAEADRTTVGAAISATSDLSPERIDSLCREAVEAAVITMFVWQKGDFSFDVRVEPVEGDPELLLPMGVNAQYLAMEAARMRDENSPAMLAEAGVTSPMSQDPPEATTGSPATDASAFDEMSAEEMFGVVGNGGGGEEADDLLPPVTGEDLITAADALARATLERVEAAFGDDAPDFVGDLASRGPEDTQDFDVDDFDAPEAVTKHEVSGDEEVAEAELIEFSEADVFEPELVQGGGPIVDPFAAQADADAERTGDAGHSDEVMLEEAADVEEITADESLAEAAVEPLEDSVEQTLDSSSLETPAISGTGPQSTPPPETDWRALGERPVVVVDESLGALEWVKAHLRDRFAQVHIFQRSDQGLARIRQYLIRGAAPILIVAPDIRVDHLSGLRNARDFVERLKAQSRRLDAVWLVSEDAGAVEEGQRKGASLRRPSDSRMRSEVGSDALQAEGCALGDRLGEILTAAARVGPAATMKPASSAILERLRDTTRQLGNASSGGEILPLVIRFTSEIFSRVAMFMVRDDVASGLGQVGLDRCGGPDDDAFRKVQIQVSVTGWMRSVVDGRTSITGPPSDEGDRDFASALGDRVPEVAYCAPIESAGQVVAILYADNLPHGGPAGDTSALDVVLHHAGLALDRAALERALQEETSA